MSFWRFWFFDCSPAIPPFFIISVYCYSSSLDIDSSFLEGESCGFLVNFTF